jgi:hypothetical protein
MTLFFVLAGFFARMLLHRGGVRAFSRIRATRSVVPLVVGWLALNPASVAPPLGAAPSSSQPSALPRSNDPFWFPLAHLWFLYVLVWLYAAMLLARSAFEWVNDRHGRLRRRLDVFMRAVVDRCCGCRSSSACISCQCRSVSVRNSCCLAQRAWSTGRRGCCSPDCRTKCSA